MVFNCQVRQGYGCGSWRFCIFATKDSARATEVSDPHRGAVKFKRSSPEGLNLFREQNQTNNQSTLLVKVLLGYAAVLALHWDFQKERKQTHHLVWTEIDAWLSASNFLPPKATEKSIYGPKDLCPQSLTHFVAVSEHPVWGENYPSPDGSRSCCLPVWEMSAFDPDGTWSRQWDQGMWDVPVALHIAVADAFHVGEQSGIEREELISKYSFADQKSWDIYLNLDYITSQYRYLRQKSGFLSAELMDLFFKQCHSFKRAERHCF